MLNKKFELDIENIKNELAIEGMSLSKNDIELLQKYSTKQINQQELIDKIIQDTKYERKF